MNQSELIEAHKKLSAELADVWADDLREVYLRVLGDLARLIESHGPSEEFYKWADAAPVA